MKKKHIILSSATLLLASLTMSTATLSDTKGSGEATIGVSAKIYKGNLLDVNRKKQKNKLIRRASKKY